MNEETIDGSSQIFIIAPRAVVARSFPRGFCDARAEMGIKLTVGEAKPIKFLLFDPFNPRREVWGWFIPLRARISFVNTRLASRRARRAHEGDEGRERTLTTSGGGGEERRANDECATTARPCRYRPPLPKGNAVPPLSPHITRHAAHAQPRRHPPPRHSPSPWSS